MTTEIVVKEATEVNTLGDDLALAVERNYQIANKQIRAIPRVNFISITKYHAIHDDRAERALGRMIKVSEEHPLDILESEGISFIEVSQWLDEWRQALAVVVSAPHVARLIESIASGAYEGTVTCPSCLGKGFHRKKNGHTHHGKYQTMVNKECKTCDGSGQVWHKGSPESQKLMAQIQKLIRAEGTHIGVNVNNDNRRVDAPDRFRMEDVIIRGQKLLKQKPPLVEVVGKDADTEG